MSTDPRIIALYDRALEGFVAFGPDFLTPIGGTPTDEDRARAMIGTLDPAEVTRWAQGVVAALRERPEVAGGIGAIGFCWGGAAVGRLAVAEPGLGAAVVYCGRQPAAEGVPWIEAPLPLHDAGEDPGVNAGIEAFTAALDAHGKRYELFMYEGANHAFTNDTNAARYDPEAAAQAWARTIACLEQHLAG
jgi:carboxymethylenebutenolidase